MSSAYGQGYGYQGGSNQSSAYGFQGYGQQNQSGQSYPTGYNQQGGSGGSGGYPPGGGFPPHQPHGSNPTSRSSGGPDYNWWIPGDGILREVIQSDIQRYLGADAHCKPGKNAEGHDGYYISAYRNFTPAMIEDLKNDSANWRRERQSGGATVATSTGMVVPDKYEHSQTHRSRQYWGPTGSTPQASPPQPVPQSSQPPSTPHYSQHQTASGYSTGQQQQYNPGKPSANQFTPATTSGYRHQHQQLPTAGQTSVSPTPGYESSGQHYVYSSTPGPSPSAETPRGYPNTQSQNQYPGQNYQPAASTRPARAGYYIASDGREYPISQQPGR